MLRRAVDKTRLNVFRQLGTLPFDGLVLVGYLCVYLSFQCERTANRPTKLSSRGRGVVYVIVANVVDDNVAVHEVGFHIVFLLDNVERGLLVHLQFQVVVGGIEVYRTFLFTVKASKYLVL